MTLMPTPPRVMPTPQRRVIVLARVLAGQDVPDGYHPPEDCELADVTYRLAKLPPEERPAVWTGFLGTLEDHDAHALRQAIARSPLDGPLPEHDAQAPAVATASPRNGAAAPVERWPEGARVKALDRDNFGTVVSDDGRTVIVRFVSPDGYEATKPLDRSILELLSGPAAAVPEDTPWGSIRIAELPGAVPFPVDALPPIAARLVTEGAAAIGCPTDFLGLAVLAVASGAIGRSAALRVKSNYFVSAALYAANVGPPSDGKTPALGFASGAIRRIDAMLKAEHDQAVELWRESSESEGGKGRKGPVSKPPRPRRIVIDDATIEAMALLLADNPRGLLMERDELTALLMGMNQYKAGGKGSDRANLLKVWAGQAITRDRVAHESNIPIRCPHPFLTIIGGLTPDMLPELSDRKDRSDGFLDRFLMAYPEPLPVPDWQEDGLDVETADEWARLVMRLWKRPLDRTDGGQEHPHVLRLQGNALDAWRERYNAHSIEMRAAEFSDDLRGAWGKFRDYAARLALILVLMDHASDPTADEAALPELTARHVRDAWRLIDYFKVMAVRVRLAIAGGPALRGSAASRVILKWIRSNDLNEFTESELGQARRKLTDAQRGDALAELAKLNVVRPAPRREPSPNGGRPPSPSWVVNPSLLETRNPNNPGNPP